MQLRSGKVYTIDVVYTPRKSRNVPGEPAEEPTEEPEVVNDFVVNKKSPKKISPKQRHQLVKCSPPSPPSKWSGQIKAKRIRKQNIHFDRHYKTMLQTC